MKNIISRVFAWTIRAIFKAFLSSLQFILHLSSFVFFHMDKALLEYRKEKGFHTDFDQKYTSEQLTRLALLIPNHVPLTYGQVSFYFWGFLSKNNCYKVIDVAFDERKTRKPVFTHQTKSNRQFIIDTISRIMERASLRDTPPKTSES